MHRDAGRLRHGGGIHPSVLSKGKQRRRGGLFIIGLGAGKVLEMQRIFARISPNSPKIFCATFAYKFSPTKIIKTFFGVTSKKVFMCFSAKLGRYFLKSSNVGRHFYADFQGCCPDFQQIKTFGDLLTPSAPPPPLLFITVS